MQFIDLSAQQARIKDRIDGRIQAVLKHGKYILGPEVIELEEALSQFCGVKHSIGCANGTDALQLALMALEVGPGDAVFVPSFTFAATAEVVALVGATPVFVDIDFKTYNIDPESLKRAIIFSRKEGLNSRAVIPVDLFGLPADYNAIRDITRTEGLQIIADSAQGFGGVYHNRRTGTLGDISTTSFFPAKPLGCYGDGGAVFTDDDGLADHIRSLRFHGKGSYKYDNVRIGLNSRLDTLQAAILLEKLAIYEDEIAHRNEIADRYTHALSEYYGTPTIPDGYRSIWAQYTLLSDNEAQRYQIMTTLKSAGIPTMIYYPTPLHQQKAYKAFPVVPTGLPVSDEVAKRVFSLPMHPYLSLQDQSKIISAVKDAVANV